MSINYYNFKIPYLSYKKNKNKIKSMKIFYYETFLYIAQVTN